MSSRRRLVGLDEAGDCLHEQLLAAGEAADAGDTRATRRDSPRTWIRECVPPLGRPSRGRRGHSAGRRGRPEAANLKKSLRWPAGAKTGGYAPHSRAARAARGAADEALGVVGGGVEGGLARVDDGAELRDRRAQELGLAVAVRLRDRLPAASAGLLHSMSRIWTKNSKPCARTSSHRKRTPIVGQRRESDVG
jgi:hypothetical protein